MKTKLIGLLTVFLVGILALCSLASAAITIEEVEMDGTELEENVPNALDIVRGEEYTVKVVFTSNESLDNVQVEAYLRGYDHDDRVEDITDVFDAKANITYSKRLNLKIPQRINIEDSDWTLRIEIAGQNGDSKIVTYNLDISTDRHLIDIKDIIFSPAGSVQSGRALLASVRLKNYGQKDEDGIKITVSIPDLEISASDYIDELVEGESTTSEELYLRIPTCADEGTYDVRVEVSYDDGDEKVIEMESIRVTSDETCSGTPVVVDPTVKPTIVYDASAQDITEGGAGSIYALTMSNPTNTAKTISVSVRGVDVFGTARVSPSNVMVLGSGETKTAYIYVNADKNAKAGQYSFTAEVAGLGATTQEIALTANVVKGSSVSGIKTALEIGLVVLVIILVILGLIIGFNKLKGSEEDSEDESQTYY
jgi:hypothetical protein